MKPTTRHGDFFSSGGYSVQWSGLILTIMVVGHIRNISVKLFCNRAIGLGEDVKYRVFFLFLTLAAIFVQRNETI